MSYNGVGLSTPRGSGTSGFVQSNRFQAKANPATVAGGRAASSSLKPEEIGKPMAKDIAEHERKRKIESELLMLSETLSDQRYAEAEIAEKVREARIALEVQKTEAAGAFAAE